MRILGIETSCDETAAAVIEADTHTQRVKLLANVVSSSLSLHAQTGGIIPEVAAREQIKYIIPVINQALKESNSLINKDIDAIAVTYGPGLIGSLLVGVETAKTLAYVWNKPLIPVNHLYGHIYANWIFSSPSLRDHKVAKQSRLRSKIATSPMTPRNDMIVFPALALVVSGGHTDLVLMKSHNDIQWLGGTRDDAAGEAFDKIGRLLNLPYPGGLAIAELAKKGSPEAYHFPRPLHNSKDFDFSFSGLKAAVFREVSAIKQPASLQGGLSNGTINDISASVQAAIVDILVAKTINAAEKYQVESIILGGGVAANQSLRENLQLNAKRSDLNPHVFVPDKNLCTDNAAMIAAAGFFHQKKIPWQTLTADPQLYFD